MFKSPLILGIMIFSLVQVSYAEPKESELLNQYNDDPSLLLEPSLYVEAPPAAAPAPEMPAPEVSVIKPTEVPEKIEAQAKLEAPLDVPKKTEESEKLVLAPAAKPIEPVKAKVEEPTPVCVSKEAKSEMVALPGVTDFSIILSGDKFFPSVIRMKQNGIKNRLLFVSTSQKPAALVFVKPKIQRWISSQSENKSLEEYREVNASKITEIEFDAEPGVYEYYDALSGARGEIKVE